MVTGGINGAWCGDEEKGGAGERVEEEDRRGQRAREPRGRVEAGAGAGRLGEGRR